MIVSIHGELQFKIDCHNDMHSAPLQCLPSTPSLIPQNSIHTIFEVSSNIQVMHLFYFSCGLWYSD